MFSLDFSTDGQLVVSRSFDELVEIWLHLQETSSAHLEALVEVLSESSGIQEDIWFWLV